MSIVFDAEGIVIGERAKLEQIAQQYLNDQEAKEMNYSLEAKINEDGNLEFKAQVVGRNFHTPDVENVIERYLDNEVECYKLWGTTDGCWEQYTNDTEGRFYKQWYVDDYTNGAKKVFFDDYDEAKAYAMNIIKNNPGYVEGLEESGMDEEEYFVENFLDYLELNQAPVQIVNITRVNPEDVVNTDMYNEDIPTTEKGNYIGKYQNLVIPMGFHDKIVDVEYFYPDNLSLLDDNSSFCCVEDSMSSMDWYPEITGYLVRFVAKQNFKIEKGKSIGMIFENLEDAQTKLASYYEKLEIEGDDYSQCDLGDRYFNGNGVDKNYELAAKWYKKAAEQGNAFAQSNLGLCYEFGHGLQQDYTLAAEWYKKAAEQGNAHAQWCFGNCCYNGNGVEQDYTLATEWYKKAAEQGNANAQCSLGYNYFVGNGVEQDYTLATEWFKKAAEQGNANAQCNLGYNYYVGNGVEQSYTLAANWWQKAAEQGNAIAQSNLGECYENGYGVEKDISQAVMWYKKSAEQGFEVAIKWLEEHPNTDEDKDKEEKERYERADWAFTIACGTFNEGNPEKESDFKEAFDLFSEAAELGYAEAMAYMGVMYRNGFVVEKDDAKAAEWYQKAIDTGGRTLLTSLAYNNLGTLYQRGEGVKKDLEKARDLFQMAVDKDHNDRAKQHLEETIKELNKKANEIPIEICIVSENDE